jgi:glycosyltransferase involved in cell wall biosynthesis
LQLKIRIFFFLFFGRVEDYKGLDLICDLSNDSNTPIVRIIGKGLYPECLKSNPLIEILPRYVDDQEIPSLLKSCKALILPYKTATQNGLFKLAYTLKILIIATPLKVFVEQSKDVNVPV